MSSFCLITTTFPDSKGAKKVIAHLLESKLAACIQMMPIQSFYRWEGKLCEEQEQLLLFKTKRECYEAIETLLKEYHPYDVPQLIAFPIEKGLSAYLSWIEENTQKD